MAFYRYTQIDSLSTQKLFPPRQTTHIYTHTLTLPAPPSPSCCGLSRNKELSCVFLVLTLAQYLCVILFYFYLPHFPSISETLSTQTPKCSSQWQILHL